MEALQGLLVELAVVVLLAVVGWAIETGRKYLKTKLNKEQYDLLDRIVDSAIWAVEQRGSGVFGNKKQAAMGIIEKQLAEYKLLGKFPTSTIDAAIESNVATAFHYSKHTRETEA